MRPAPSFGSSLADVSGHLDGRRDAFASVQDTPESLWMLWRASRTCLEVPRTSCSRERPRGAGECPEPSKAEASDPTRAEASRESR
jgi:hypothetical protein